VNAGFETRYRDGNWVPVQITLHNDGPDFSGTLALSPSSGSATGLTIGPDYSKLVTYQLPITLANGAQKQVTIDVPLYFDAQDITVKLLDSSGNVVRTQDGTLNPLSDGDIFVGVLSDQNAGFGPLNAVSLPAQGSSVIVEFLNATTMPSMAAVLKNFNVIVLDNFTTSNLSPAQLTTLQTWVNRGGILILVGGPEWHRTLAPLPVGLSPVVVNGTTTLPPGAQLLPFGGPQTGRAGQGSVPDTVQSPVTASIATLQGDPDKSEIVLASGATPLITQTQQGQGTVSYLAFDPTLDPIAGWPGASALWKGLLFRGLGDLLLYDSNSYPSPGYFNGFGQSPLAGRMSGLLQSLLPSYPSPWTLAILLIGYILVLGPVRLLLLRRLKRRDWSWRIVLSTIVLFSLLTYGLAIEEKGTSVLSNSISLVQLSQNDSPAHITTYLGVFAPNQGNFQVHIPGEGLVQPSPDTYYWGGPGSANSDQPATITPVHGGTNVNLQGVQFGTLHSILSEQDRQLHEGLASHLTINNGTLVGTVTNTLSYALSDAYVLTPNDVLSLGHLAAGQTKQITLPLSNTMPNPSMTLADLIAQNSGSSFPYGLYPYNSGSQPLTEQQRHMSILLALEGKGYYGYPCIGPCGMPAAPLTPLLPLLPLSPINGGASGVSSNAAFAISIASRVSLSFSGGAHMPFVGNNDPLLVPGSSFTLIGWAEKPLDAISNITINDINPIGLHETLIQAPLNVNLSGALNLPPYFITGSLIDAEGNDLQAQFPSSYALNTGSMTFEFAVPNLADLQVRGLTITEPSNTYQPPSGGGSPNSTSVLFHIYNWQTGSWNPVSFNQNAFTTNNVRAYLGPNGRVLLQFANKNTALGTIFFSKPILNLQGVVVGS